MRENFWKLVFDNPIMGFAYHRIVLDDEGKPVDFVFLELNEAFERITGLSRKNLINKYGTVVIPEIVTSGLSDIIKLYGEIALNNGTYVYEEYSRH